MSKELDHCTTNSKRNLCKEFSSCHLEVLLESQASAGGIQRNGASAGPVQDIPNWQALAVNLEKAGGNGKCPKIEGILEQHHVLTEQKRLSGELIPVQQYKALQARYQNDSIAFSASE